MGLPYRAHSDPENDACRRASRSQAPAMRRPARTAKPQVRIPEHEASFRTRGPNRSRRRREQEQRISRPSQKDRSAGMGARQCTLPGFCGRGWGAAHLRASGGDPGARRGRRSRLRHGASSTRHFAIGAAGRRSRARPADRGRRMNDAALRRPTDRLEKEKAKPEQASGGALAAALIVTLALAGWSGCRSGISRPPASDHPGRSRRDPRRHRRARA